MCLYAHLMASFIISYSAFLYSTVQFLNTHVLVFVEIPAGAPDEKQAPPPKKEGDGDRVCRWPTASNVTRRVVHQEHQV